MKEEGRERVDWSVVKEFWDVGMGTGPAPAPASGSGSGSGPSEKGMDAGDAYMKKRRQKLMDSSEVWDLAVLASVMRRVEVLSSKGGDDRASALGSLSVKDIFDELMGGVGGGIEEGEGRISSSSSSLVPRFSAEGIVRVVDFVVEVLEEIREEGKDRRKEVVGVVLRELKE
ncbi:hypothetical protein HK102_010160, partial [Quaeritorhiza haematococci]